MKINKARIVTFHNAHNVGAILQCYALKNAIKNLGVDCSVVDVKNEFFYNMYKPKIQYKNVSLIRLIYNILIYPFKCRKYRYYNRFINKYILDEDSSNTDQSNVAYICGSDQVWNDKCSNFDKRYFLDFVKNKEQKNSYAASFGFDKIPDEHYDEYKALLSDFNKIAVREHQGAKIVKDLLGIDVPVTIDPTFLLTKEDWGKIMSPKVRHKKYILIYVIERSNTLVEFVKRLQASTGFEVVYIQDELIRNIKQFKYKSFFGPQEWLSLFWNASYIVTNSFHGTAFSINFNKQFFVEFLPSSFNVNSRLENILDTFDLKDRRIIDSKNDNMDKLIDYNRVNDKLRDEVEKSKNYLKSILEDTNE